jgi:predicted aconitase
MMIPRAFGMVQLPTAVAANAALPAVRRATTKVTASHRDSDLYIATCFGRGAVIRVYERASGQFTMLQTSDRFAGMTGIRLSPTDRAMLDGGRGEAARMAMRIVVAMAEVSGAERLLDVTSAHVDGCLYHGQASLDFAERLAAGGAAVSVPTTLNVGALDLLHPDRYRGDPDTATKARRLMALYVAMGCRPTWTCAPYQLDRRPGFGEHVAWAESNAIVFANSVLGARTDRYGDFIDICAALTGRAPAAGLHLDQNRTGGILFRLYGLPPALLEVDVLFPVLGHLIGMESGALVPVIDGLPATTTEDQLKALGAAAASSGAVGLFHAVGVTPEAPTMHAAFGGRQPSRTVDVTPARLGAVRDSMTTATGDRIDAVSVGTPHFSLEEFAALTPLVNGLRLHPDVAFFVSTSRAVLAEVEARGWLPVYERAEIRMVVDTCTYITPILDPGRRVVMTNSGKWAYYAPGNIGVRVVFGSLEECVRSAIDGRVWRDDRLWRGV